LDFSPDGLFVVGGGRDHALRVWDATTGELLHTLAGHLAPITSARYAPNGSRIVSASEDSTLKVWRSDGALLATLLRTQGSLNFRHRPWVTITPEGFFAASEPGSEQVLSVVRGYDVYSIDQFWQSLFSPDLVREKLTGDRVQAVERAKAVVDINKVLDSGPPPDVTFLSPSEKIQSSSDLVKVRIRVVDKGKGVGRIEWRLNGVTVAVASPPKEGGPTHELVQEIPLDAGENLVEAVAYNQGNILASRPARAAIELAASSAQQKAKLHILAIGINAYVDPGWVPSPGEQQIGFQPLKLAANDATEFAKDLRVAAAPLYSEVKVTTVLDDDATRAKLERVIDTIGRDVQPRDTFVLFMAGHGISEKGHFYFIPQDYQSGAGALARSAVGQDMMQDWLANRVKAKRALVLLDTCESGAAINSFANSRLDAPASDAAVGRLHEAIGRPVLTAAATDQPAWEGYKGHGVFTFAVLDALRNGDRDGNGMIDLNELVTFVQDRVPKLAAELGGTGRAAVVVTRSIRGDDDRQSAKFGSRGENFVLARRLR
jgi:hypothetical protein